jgi:hydrogenase expression/formation protein HypD
MTAGETGRERELARKLALRIADAAAGIGREVRLMEVCGTHTVALRKSGLPSLLPAGVTLISGPGCPVCVTPTGIIDNALALVERERAVVATFGDMLRVPGSAGVSLARHTARGAVRVVYSPLQLLPMAAQVHPRPLVFIGIGFETTIPTVAAAFLRAWEHEVPNLYLYAAFKTVVPALRALLALADSRIDAFLLPGHVSTVIGSEAYGLLEEPGGAPAVVAGFEPLDMLAAILIALRQVAAGERRVVNAYRRAVRPQGNPQARAVMDRLLEPSDELWRGLGTIPRSGRSLRPQYRRMNAAAAFDLAPPLDSDPPGCLCGRVIRGASRPPDCPLFGRRCTPEQPVGPCMVSSEGTCAAWLRYA